MGCNNTKSTTSNGDKNAKTNDKDDIVYVHVEEAEEYVRNKLGVNQEKAKKIVASINKNNDEKVAEQELVQLWKKIQAKKEEVRPYFTEIDKDGSGFITSEEALVVLKKIFKNVDDAKLQAVMKRFDDNSDGKINYDEFVIFFAHISAKKDEVCRAVADLEKDEQGTVSAEDIAVLIEGHCGLDDKYAQALVQDFDQNKDGRISSSEFDLLMNQLFP